MTVNQCGNGVPPGAGDAQCPANARARLAGGAGSARRGVVLGIDPGLERTGYAVMCGTGWEPRLLEAGVVRVEPNRTLPERLVELAGCVARLIESCRPEVLVCESLYAHYRHPRTAILMAHARGVILAEAARAGTQVWNVSATQVKKNLTGNGRAGKAQVQRALCAALRLAARLEPHDVADAVAVALCGLGAPPRAAAPRRRCAPGAPP